uniref:Uncharacterized protein n=1 Tax=Oryza punctata TaxID=4537 RepID=A0A0E0M2W9_ORYPU
MQRFQGLRRSPSRPGQLEPKQNDQPYIWFPVHIPPPRDPWRSPASAPASSDRWRAWTAWRPGRLAAATALPPPLLPRVHLAGEGTGRMATTIGFFHPRFGAAPPSCKKAESNPAPSLQDAVEPVVAVDASVVSNSMITSMLGNHGGVNLLTSASSSTLIPAHDANL